MKPLKSVKIPQEKAIEKLMVQFVKDVREIVKDDTKALGSVMALMIGATVAAGAITAEEVVGRVISHLVDNDMLHPEEISAEEMQAMHEAPDKEFLN